MNQFSIGIKGDAPQSILSRAQVNSQSLTNIQYKKNQAQQSLNKKVNVVRSTTLSKPKILKFPDINQDKIALYNQFAREGLNEKELVKKQASKEDTEQASIYDYLPKFDYNKQQTELADVVIVGCGPAGLALASQLTQNDVNVLLIGRDTPFVNNYGVWKDEFDELKLTHTLEHVWKDTECFFSIDQKVNLNRPYGRVSRKKLRDHLLKECKSNKITFLDGEVSEISIDNDLQQYQVQINQQEKPLSARLVVLASGQAAGRFLEYDKNAPKVAAQTAYGIECEVEGYEDSYHPQKMLFMDYRRLHTGMAPNTSNIDLKSRHPNGQILWGSKNEVPSFLYAMPLDNKTENRRVFLEETCLCAKPVLPFAVLKRRLYRRLEAMNMKVKKIIEEEWSFIPVGGPLPISENPICAFGAAANLVHPSTGYSISRSFREAPHLAQQVAQILKRENDVQVISKQVWDALWPLEKRRQASFHLFGMELLAKMNHAAIGSFFTTFFSLSPKYWEGFLASQLSSSQLIFFALQVYFKAPLDVQLKLMQHLYTDQAGKYMTSVYLEQVRKQFENFTKRLQLPQSSEK